jgi:hypothetical protein
VEEELVGIVEFQHSAEGVVDLDDEFIGVVVVKPILEHQLTGFWVLPVEGKEEHRVLVVKINSKGAVFSYQPCLKQLKMSPL